MGSICVHLDALALREVDQTMFNIETRRLALGTRLFDDDPKSYRLDLVSSTEFSNGIVGLQYRRHR